MVSNRRAVAARECKYTGTWTLDCLTMSVKWDDSMYTLHGVSVDSFTPTLSFMHASYPGLADAMFSWALRPESAQNMCYSSSVVVSTLEGPEADLLVLVVPSVREGCLAGVHGVSYKSTPITSRTPAPSDGEAKYQMLFRYAPTGLLQAGVDKRILLVNPALCSLLGWSVDELLSMTTDDITHPNDRAITAEAVRRLSSGETEHCSYEKRYLKKDGSFVWIQLSVCLFRATDGRPLNYLGQCQDISVRKASEFELLGRVANAEEERERLLAENKTLQTLTMVDPLTGLSNRTAFEASIHEVTSKAPDGEYAQVCVDIGSLSLRNRSQGTAAVDNLLRLVAQALQRACISAKCIARLSGGNYRILIAVDAADPVDGTISRIQRELDSVKWRKVPITPQITWEPLAETFGSNDILTDVPPILKQDWTVGTAARSGEDGGQSNLILADAVSADLCL